MKLDLHVERLVVDGSPLGPGEERALERAVAEELRGLLLAGGLEALGGSAGGGSHAALVGGTVDWRPESGAGGLGRSIARAAYGALGGAAYGALGGAAYGALGGAAEDRKGGAP